MNIDLGKILDISARVALALFVACLLLLCIPASILPFDITGFREQYGIWLFIALAVSIGLLISYAVKWIIAMIKAFVDKRKMWHAYRYVMSRLSNDEKKYIKNFYDKKQLAIMLDLTDPVVKRLETFKILSMSAGTSMAPRGMAPGFVQPWVFELLDKHPEYLEITEED
ncbi:MAG: superinfection exclusion B family protein [Oscillospiraceae bacterium]|nr:superinfection exclusion B family protein [Oscillospiraceae bacterium]